MGRSLSEVVELALTTSISSRKIDCLELPRGPGNSNNSRFGQLTG